MKPSAKRLCPEERAEVSRRNGAKSRGPKTEAGRAASSRNSTRHGMRAKVTVMAIEDPEVVAARLAEWDDHYLPRSPAARHLVNQCVAATLLADRCRLAHDAALADQVDDAGKAWDHARCAEVADAWNGLARDPKVAVAAMEKTGHGCRWLISRWERLGERLKARGYWGRADCDEAVLLSGVKPTPEGLRGDLNAYLLVLSNLRCRPEPSDEAVAAMLAPERRPAEVARRQPSAFVFAPEKARKLLGDQVGGMIESLGASLRRAEPADASSRARALDRALVLQDEAEARLFFRYHAESRSTFHRAYKDLVATLERDAAGLDGSEPDSPDEPDDPGAGAAGEPNAPPVAVPSPSAPTEEPTAASPNEPGFGPRLAKAISPNEPGRGGRMAVGSDEQEKGSVENPGLASGVPAADPASGE